MEVILETIFAEFKSQILVLFSKLGFNIPEYLIKIIFFVLALLLIALLTAALKIVKNKATKILNGVSDKELLKYYTKGEVHDASVNYIETYGQKNDPSEFLEPKEAIANAEGKLNLIKFFKALLKKKHYERRFFLLLGDSGMGKTTFLINLFLVYKKSMGLNKRPIFFIPLSDPQYKKRIDDIKDHTTNSILLLDAFDENINAWSNPESSLKELLEFTDSFSTVIITSRGQFFTSKFEDFHLLNTFINPATKKEIKIEKLFLSPLDNFSVIKYLSRKYLPFKIKSLLKAYRIIKNCPNLVVRPMILNNIDYLLNQEKSYVFTADIYLDLIISWIEREKKFIDNAGIVISISKKLARNMYNLRNHRRGLYIEENSFRSLCNSISKGFDSDILKTRSLLNRTDDKIKFSHKSIFEYFLASSSFETIDLDSIHKIAFDNPFYLDGLSDAHRFYNELFIIKISIPYINSYGNLPITAESLLKTKELNLAGSRIKSLEFVQQLTWLSEINLSSTWVRDLRHLHKLKNLKKLTLKNTYYSSKSDNFPDAIEQLNNLKKEVPNIQIVT